MSRVLVADHALASRLERAEASANARFVETRARLAPESGAAWIEVEGAYAMYDGPRSPCTQTFGLGLFEIPTTAGMDTLEEFFAERGAPVFHEVSPLADKSLLFMFHDRGYQPFEFTSVMFLDLSAPLASSGLHDGRVRARIARAEESGLWAETAAEGWRELTEIISEPAADLLRAAAATEGAVPFLAELDGTPVAAAYLATGDGVALLAGASTIPEWRNRGAQRALLDTRLRFAAAAGCDLAMVCAEPGSASQRNAERHGFRIAYTRIKWRR
jgi:GNAT superfamily N-acetyltransferase